MATGGTLTSLAEADTGSLAGGAQMDVWAQIVRRDAQLVGAALHRALFRPFLESAFPGRPIGATFELGMEEEASAAETADLAVKLRSAGYTVNQAQLEEKTALKLEKDQPPQPGNPFGGPVFNKGFNPPSDKKNSGSDGRARTPAAPPSVLAAFAKDTGPAAAAIARLLQNPSPEAAAELLADLPSLIPEDPALAAIIAEEMAKEFGKAAEPVENSGTSEGARKGWETRRKNGWTPEQLAENNATVEQLVNDLDKRGPHNSKAWKNTPKDLGEVNESLAADIMAANPKMKVRAGTMQTIDQDQLNHAIEEHGVGNETWPNQVPITKEDLKKIPDVLSAYDEITPGTGKDEGKHQEAVVFRKKYDDGTICCVETDWFRRKDNRRELRFQTMWKEKLEDEK